MIRSLLFPQEHDQRKSWEFLQPRGATELRDFFPYHFLFHSEHGWSKDANFEFFFFIPSIVVLVA